MELLFETVSGMQSKCQGCHILIDKGYNTTFNQAKGSHICNHCGHLLKN